MATASRTLLGEEVKLPCFPEMSADAAGLSTDGSYQKNLAVIAFPHCLGGTKK